MLRMLLVVLSTLADYHACDDGLSGETLWGAVNAGVFITSAFSLHFRGFCTERNAANHQLDDMAGLN